MSEPRQSLLHGLRRVLALGHGNGLTDAQLLERFVGQRDEAAFEVLVWRHSGIVFSACRRVLCHAQDVEDAFQATFLVLLRRARSIRRRETLGSWLYQVAYRMALRARTSAARRALHEKQTCEETWTEPSYDPQSPELRFVLDEELNRLPEKYRDPLVLCYLQGMTKEEAASRLGCPAGTVSSRLTRGRERLRARLTKRGLALTTAAVALALEKSSALAMPPSHLVQTTLRAVLAFGAGSIPTTAGLSVEALTMAKGALRAMFITKLKIAACLALAVGVAGTGAGLFMHPLRAAPGRQDSGAVVLFQPAEQPNNLVEEDRPKAEKKNKPEDLAVEEADAADKNSEKRFPPAAGRSWEIAPRTVHAEKADLTGFFTSDTVLGIYGKDNSGGLVLTLSYPLREGKVSLSKYRPVALDADGSRYSFKQQWTAYNKDIASYQYRLDSATVPLDQITRIGVEKIK